MCAVADVSKMAMAHRAVLHDVEHAAHQDARADADGLARLEVDRHAVALLEVLHQAHQERAVVVRPRDVVPAAEVHPLHLRDDVAEAALHRHQRALERVAAQLAQRVEVQPVEVFGRDTRRVERRARGAQARARRARVIERHRHLGVLRVDAQPDVHARLAHARPVLAQLRGAVHHHVLREAQDLGHVGVAVGRRIRVHLAAQLLARQLRLVRRAAGGTRPGTSSPGRTC
jgi:hypothetical protein